MNKNVFAKTPPMGWNSWDCYGAAVTEEILLKNTDYMAEHLKKYGWEYIVCDIQWYEPTADSSHYHLFADLCMDEFGRVIPAPNRFPSSAGGKGFGPIAEYVHNKGLKFGIHIMRGIPRQAVAQNIKIKGTEYTARQITHPASICCWNSDMYGLDCTKPGAQEYYDSLLELYASWGVDFIKVDDICVKYGRTGDESTLAYGGDEIEMLRRAIDRCCRPIVLSLSPGPAMLDKARHLRENANMWRITNDLWDSWDNIMEMFSRCNEWSPYVSEGCYPDCDMLPLGELGKGFATEHHTYFTPDEQKTMMTLWCLFGSPLMLGAEMTLLDDDTLALLTNTDILAMLPPSVRPHQITRTDNEAVWYAKDDTTGTTYVALFNLSDAPQTVSSTLADADCPLESVAAKELWSGKALSLNGGFSASLAPHACSVCRFETR